MPTNTNTPNTAPAVQAQATAQVAQAQANGRSANGTPARANSPASKAMQALGQAHPYVRAYVRAAQGNPQHVGSMQAWARLACGKLGLAPTVGNTTKVGRYVRGYACRSTGNGAHANGRATYGALTAPQVLALLGYAALAHNAGSTAQAQAQAGKVAKVLAKVQGRNAQAAQAPQGQGN